MENSLNNFKDYIHNKTVNLNEIYVNNGKNTESDEFYKLVVLGHVWAEIEEYELKEKIKK